MVVQVHFILSLEMTAEVEQPTTVEQQSPIEEIKNAAEESIQKDTPGTNFVIKARFRLQV